jgi:two-component system nitrate/nitrite response regulator NarL
MLNPTCTRPQFVTITSKVYGELCVRYPLPLISFLVRGLYLSPVAAAAFREATMQIAITERERQIIHLISEGLSNKEIGRQLDVCEGTIKVHLHRIYQKLAIHNRATLAALAVRKLE